jgi:hypothetical protein
MSHVSRHSIAWKNGVEDSSDMRPRRRWRASQASSHGTVVSDCRSPLSTPASVCCPDQPVLAALGGVRRLLIADEVGLRKTIQAGLIIAELQRQTPSIQCS